MMVYLEFIDFLFHSRPFLHTKWGVSAERNKFLYIFPKLVDLIEIIVTSVVKYCHSVIIISFLAQCHSVIIITWLKCCKMLWNTLLRRHHFSVIHIFIAKTLSQHTQYKDPIFFFICQPKSIKKKIPKTTLWLRPTKSASGSLEKEGERGGGGGRGRGRWKEREFSWAPSPLHGFQI